MKISIAMTTYNGREYIEEQLNSIKNQTVLPDEVVIYDDCSLDGTYDIVLSFIRKNKLQNWHPYKNEYNIGWRKNYRKAIFACDGDIIFLADQDDIWNTKKIELMSQEIMKNESIKLLVSNYDVLYEDRKEKIHMKNNSKNDGSVRKVNCFSVLRPGCTFCFRNDIVEKMRTLDLIDHAHDAVIWTYAQLNSGVYLYNKILILYRRHNSSASTPKKSMGIERRLDELDRSINMNSFALQIAKKDKNYKPETEKLLLNNRKFIFKRKQTLKENNIFKMSFFVLTHYRQYPTLRNALSDIYIIKENR